MGVTTIHRIVMGDFQAVATARLEYDDDEMSEEAAKENLRSMLQSGQITPTITIERDND